MECPARSGMACFEWYSACFFMPLRCRTLFGLFLSFPFYLPLDLPAVPEVTPRHGPFKVHFSFLHTPALAPFPIPPFFPAAPLMQYFNF